MAERALKVGTGWIRDPADPRDYSEERQEVRAILDRSGVRPLLQGRAPLPRRTDLRRWFPPVWFQGGFNTCSAHVVAALLAYFEQRAFGKSVEPSRLFLYKVTKNALFATGNAPVYIRQTMGLLALIGVPPEKYWSYPDPGTIHEPRQEDPRLDQEPTPFCYALAHDYRASVYYRIDTGARETTEARSRLLRSLKAHLAVQIPLTVGFDLYPSLSQSFQNGGLIPCPAASEASIGSHAVVAVGHDDHRTIRNTAPGGPSSTGAILVRNSWSAGWGESGYGWLPYAYVLEGRTSDYWTLLRADWHDTGQFQLELDT